jgi:hypothetical protein
MDFHAAFRPKESTMTTPIHELGTQLPDNKNSPVAWEADENMETLREAIPDEPFCFFNDIEYAHGTIVRSGNVLLRCERGVWVPTEPPGHGQP